MSSMIVRTLEGGYPTRETLGAGIAGLLGVELGRRQRPVLHRRHETVTAVLGPGDHRRPERAGGLELPAANRVGVHEVEPGLRLQPLEQSRIGTGHDGVPTHVRHDRRLEFLHRAGPLTDPVGLLAVLDARFEQDLHADADSQHRPRPGQSAPDNSVTAYRFQPGHAGRIRTDTGDDETVRVQRHLEIVGDLHIGAGPAQRPLRRRQIAGAVVEYHYTSHNTPPATQPTANNPMITEAMRASLRHNEITPPIRNPPTRIIT